MALVRQTGFGTQILILTLLLLQSISSTVISFKDGHIIYEYNDEDIVGEGISANVFKGIRKEGDQIDEVAFKEANSKDYDHHWRKERDIYQRIGEHVSIPKFYGLFTMTKKNRTVLVTELLGRTLSNTSKSFEHNSFSSKTVMMIGLQVLDALEYMHGRGIVHLDLNIANIAMGYKNDSRIYIFDFGFSKIYELEMVEVEDERRIEDLKQVARMLIRFAQGKFLYDDYDEIDEKVNCRAALKEFLSETMYPKYNEVDYDELRRILQTELEKYKNESNYDKFDWQISKLD